MVSTLDTLLRVPRAHRGLRARRPLRARQARADRRRARREFLHGQVTNDIEALEPGHGCYAAFLTHKGKMLGDLRVLDLGDELLLTASASRCRSSST